MKLQESSMPRIPVKNYFKECSQCMLMQRPTKAKGTYIYMQHPAPTELIG